MPFSDDEQSYITESSQEKNNIFSFTSISIFDYMMTSFPAVSSQRIE